MSTEPAQPFVANGQNGCHDNENSYDTHPESLKKKSNGHSEAIGKNNDLEDVEIVDLTHVKRDFYEQGDFAIAVFYVKSVISTSVKVIFEARSISILFRSTDEQFLALNGQKTSETVFRWHVPLLKEEITPSESYYKLTESKLEIRLKKVASVKWGRCDQPPIAATLPLAIPTDNGSSSTSATKDVPVKDSVSVSAHSVTNSSSDRPIPLRISFDDSAVANSPPRTSSISSSPSMNIDLLHESNSTKSVHRYRIGMRGLVNQSNNCYQNSIIQILANTPHLREYCLERFTEADVNKTNPLGSKGKMVTEFVHMLRELWAVGDSLRLPPFDTAQSIGLVAANRFRPFFQHDAQEFLTYLLDTIHEDLNRGYGRQAPKNESKNGEEPPVTAESAWKGFLFRNESPLVEEFYGQICNRIVCQHCFKESNAYDPFMMLPLPIARPSKSVELHCLYVPTPLSPRDQPIRIILNCPATLTSEEIKQEIRTSLSLSHVTCELKLYALQNSQLVHFWRASDVPALTRVRWAGPKSGVDVLIYETQQSSSAQGNKQQRQQSQQHVTVQIVQMLSTSNAQITICSNCKKKADKADFPRCTRCQSVAYCDVECQKTHWKVHKATCVPYEQAVSLPLCFTVSQSASFDKFLKLVETGVKRHVSIICNADSNHNFSKLFNLELAPDLDHTDSNKAKKQAAREKVEINSSNFHACLSEASSSGHVLKLRLYWQNNRTSPYGLQVNEIPLTQFEGYSLKLPVSQDRVSLIDCFRLYFEPELMHSANAWMCPQCKKNRTAIQRSLISRYPRYLICYIKRFSQDGYVHKDREAVSYPAMLDVSSFVASDALPASAAADFPLPKEQSKSETARHRQASSCQSHTQVAYHLYGVVNHYGTMQFGHYSSFGRLPSLIDAAHSEVPWRLFDDEMIEETSASRVVDLPDAYILFYQLAETPKSAEDHLQSTNNTHTKPTTVVSNTLVDEIVEDDEDADSQSVEDLEEIELSQANRRGGADLGTLAKVEISDLLLNDDTVD